MTTPADSAKFIAFWRDSTLKERSGAQGHFIALCGLLGIKSPTEADPHGDWFAFEKGAKKTGGGDGWADVWRRHCFAWEYKGQAQGLAGGAPAIAAVRAGAGKSTLAHRLGYGDDRDLH